MKNTIKLAVVAALALGATSAFATNGSVMIGTGAKALGMAGTGIGMSHGAESALVNPALITSVKGTEVSFGGTFFMPDVSFDNGMGAGAADSAADLSVVPMVATTTKINDNVFVGVGMWGTAGMGVDYRDSAANFKMVTNLQLMQFGVPVAYTLDGFSVALTPILQYGALDINYDTGAGTATGTTNGAGVAQDLEFGYNIGLSYAISNFTVGAVYKSQIDMEYKGQLSGAMAGFGQAYSNDTLSTPAELGLGVSYTLGANSIALDYKQIKWEDAEGYKDFAWENQDVYSLGYEYSAKTWSARAGYNYASSPITDQGLAGSLNNTLNLLGFPGIVESHYALGGTYNVTERTSFDVAYVYSPEVTDTYTVSNYPNPGTRDITTKHSQTALSAAVNFNF